MAKSINTKFVRKLRPTFSIATYVEGIKSGKVNVLSQAITLLESSKFEDHQIADAIVEQCLSNSLPSIRIGITGVPGVGKSTFIESIGNFLSNQGHKVAVLAIDPSSQNSGGSILGDKTRMESLVQQENVFIRPSPSKGALGGVAKATRESIVLCEAAGYDVVLIETVGVGQSEIAVRSMVDFFLLLMLAGAGDELQGIKRGIMEMADAVVITKAEDENLKFAKNAVREYKNALNLFPASKSEFKPQVTHCSALTNSNIDKVWDIIESYKNHTTINGFFEENRKQQAKFWLKERIRELLIEDFENNNKIKVEEQIIEKQVLKGVLSPFKGADLLMKKYKS